MYRVFLWAAAISAIVCFASLAAVSYYSPPPAASPTEQQQPGEAKAKEDTGNEHSFRGFIRFIFPDAISIFTFWLVLATIALAAIAVIQIGFLGRAE